MGYDADLQSWARAYKKVSKLTGFSVEEIYGKCLAVILDGKYAGRIGLVDHMEHGLTELTLSLRFQPKRKRVGFRFEFPIGQSSATDEHIYYSPNVFLILEEQGKIPKQKDLFRK